MKTLGQDASKNGQRSKKMYEVLVSHEAEKYYKKQNKDTKRRINKCIDILSKEPHFGPHIKNSTASLRVDIVTRLAASGSFTKFTSVIKLLR